MYLTTWLLLLLLEVSNASQVPFNAPEYNVIEKDWSQWNLSTSPDRDYTGHLVFDTVASLLQHWPNTRHRNGHNIVPGHIPTGTLLYHGAWNNEIPSTPNWVATDPEHSMLFAGDRWHLTLITVRPLNILYFDGSSGANMLGGSLDTQDVLVWGEIKPEWIYREDLRIDDLCEWGKRFRIDGFVRMEMDFEVMLCSFYAGLEVVSFVQLEDLPYDTGPRRPIPRPPAPPHNSTRISPPEQTDHRLLHRSMTRNQFTAPSSDDKKRVEHAYHFQVVSSGSWHNHFPGDTRIKLDLSRLVSFYDTRLVPSLVERRRGQERWFHRLEGISKGDIGRVQRVVGEMFERKEVGSGVNWDGLVGIVVKRYADRLEFLEFLLNGEGEGEGAMMNGTRAKKAFVFVKTMLRPYLLRTAVPPNSTAGHSSTEWAAPIFGLCTTTHTKYISSTPALVNTLTGSEKLILDSIEGTNREICRVLVGIYVEGVYAGLQEWDDLDGETPSALDSITEEKLVRKWTKDLRTLMDWLDWSLWIKCKPACDAEHLCYLPTWPYFPRTGPPGIPSFPDDDGILRPEPRCVRKLEPYDFIPAPLGMPVVG